jgi:hypothetical protein
VVHQSQGPLGRWPSVSPPGPNSPGSAKLWTTEMVSLRPCRTGSQPVGHRFVDGDEPDRPSGGTIARAGARFAHRSHRSMIRTWSGINSGNSSWRSRITRAPTLRAGPVAATRKSGRVCHVKDPGLAEPGVARDRRPRTTKKAEVFHQVAEGRSSPPLSRQPDHHDPAVVAHLRQLSPRAPSAITTTRSPDLRRDHPPRGGAGDPPETSTG